MNNTYLPGQCIRNLAALGERQLGQETKARNYIEQVLTDNYIDFKVQEYHVDIPRYTDWGLEVDGVVINSQPCGLRSGTIPAQDNIISSLISSQKNPYDANINFNPRCASISKSNHYHAPALAIQRSDVGVVAQGQDVQAFMNLERVSHQSANILVGNTVNPTYLVVSHYDSVNSGAVDNASGVALSLDLIIEKPELLQSTCFAICGNEEISFDEPVYWGHGYRVLEQGYPHLLESPRNIIVVDSFGYCDLKIITEKEVLMLGFPIEDIDTYLEKTVMISGDYAGLMNFYHSNDDTPDLITDKYYQQAKQYCVGILGPDE